MMDEGRRVRDKSPGDGIGTREDRPEDLLIVTCPGIFDVVPSAVIQCEVLGEGKHRPAAPHREADIGIERDSTAQADDHAASELPISGRNDEVGDIDGKAEEGDGKLRPYE